jgi:hypothetical protein
MRRSLLEVSAFSDSLTSYFYLEFLGVSGKGEIKNILSKLSGLPEENIAYAKVKTIVKLLFNLIKF